MPSMTYRPFSGVAGEVTRQQPTVETGLLNPAQPTPKFGGPVKLTSGKFELIEAGDTAASFRGILVRTAPGMSGSLADADTPNPAVPQGIIRRGYVAVPCTVGTPTRGGTVYMRVIAASGKRIGDLEATADGSNNVALTGVEWALPGKDANNIAEIFIR